MKLRNTLTWNMKVIWMRKMSNVEVEPVRYKEILK